ncbi:MAG: cupin domain-containing protein [Anaerolineae bacterium]|jgi:quercetin dioxygenase-like cupin family protein
MRVWEPGEIETRELIPGADVGFVHTENMTLAYWDFDPGVPLPEHSHTHEQVTNIIEGVFELTVGGETRQLEAGSVVVIPPNATHCGRSVTECRVIDVFYPVREDYR